MKQIARPNRVSYDAARLSALVIHTRGDGHLGDTSPAEVTQIAAQVASAPRAVIHIHRGLVNKTSGLAGAQRLDSYYRAASVLPVFPVWESGFF
jgi:hypothetical protein